MKASSVKADAGVRRPSAENAAKKVGQTKARPPIQAPPLTRPVWEADWAGGGIEGLAGELASMPPVQRQSTVQSLQGTHGNRFVQRLAIQAKLKVGPAGDRYEREADHVADQVMRMTETPNPVQRQEDKKEIQTKPLAASITPLVHRFTSFIKSPLQRQAEEEEEIQTKSTSSAGGFEAGSAIESQLSARRGGGRPLPSSLRGQMEAGFGADFSSVRVHTGGEATQLNRAVSAQAFTHGQDIYLGEGKGDLESSAGRKLLAHELTHTIQQTGAVQRQTPGSDAADSVSRTARSIQRLMSKEELMAKAGKPKKNILFYKMSTRYKKILSAVAEYDSYLSVQPVVRSQNGNVFAKEGKEILDVIKAAAMEYLLKHNTGKRRAVIFELVKQIEPERKALDNVAANYDLVKNLPGRTALWYAKSLPSTPAPTPPKSITPSVPKHAPPSKPLPPTPATLPVTTQPVSTPPVTTPRIIYEPPPQPLPPTPATPPVTTPAVSTPPTTIPPVTTSLPPSGPSLSTPVAPPVATPPVIPGPLPENVYMQNIAGLGGEYKWLSEQARTYAPMGWSPSVPGGLTEAQWTAIRVYSSGDYRYINPVLINSPGCLAGGMNPNDPMGEVQGNWKSSLTELATELKKPGEFLKKVEQMALEHTAMAIEGLKRLPPFVGKVYRGESRPEDVYQNDYPSGKTIEKGHFLSTSKAVTESMRFANDDPGATPPKRGILWEINAKGKKGRDISDISLFQTEQEVLFMPGSTFKIDKVDPVSGPTPLKVEMDET